jgi:hypothetical protein
MALSPSLATSFSPQDERTEFRHEEVDGEESEEEDEECEEEGEYGMDGMDGMSGDLPSDPVATTTCITERRLVSYSSSVFGVKEKDMILEGLPIEFSSAIEMSDVLRSKAPSKWSVVSIKNVSVYKGPRKLAPEGCDVETATPEELEKWPYETFFYVTAFVSPGSELDETNQESVTAHALAFEDKRRLVHVFKRVSIKLHERFLKHLYSKSPEAQARLRVKYGAIYDWTPPQSPQINPLLANWRRYAIAKPITAFHKPKPTKRKRPDAQSDGSTETATSSEFRKVQKIYIDDPKKTNTFIQGNYVYVVEF